MISKEAKRGGDDYSAAKSIQRNQLLRKNCGAKDKLLNPFFFWRSYKKVGCLSKNGYAYIIANQGRLKAPVSFHNSCQKFNNPGA